MGSAAAAAVFLFGAVATVAAISLINTGLVTRLDSSRSAFTGPGTLALASADPRLAKATDIAAADTSFRARWADAVAGAEPRVLEIIADEPAKPVIAKAPGLLPVARLTPAAAPARVAPLAPKLTAERANSVPLPPSRPVPHEIARAPAVEAAPQIAAVAPPPAAAADMRMAPKEAHNRSLPLPDLGSRTAVYDISARTVFLPNGEKLEAHSGLYDKMDDPRYVGVRMRGPTPPNVYDLTLREELFHGVRAIRLNPVDDNKMFGRDGMLAHTYMLGPNGQSNGCVSFKNYDKFLNAFLRGEVDRLVVVPDGGTKLALAARTRRDRAGRYASNEHTAESSARAW